MSEEAPAPQRSQLAEQLSQSCVGLRVDLEATRHLFQGEPLYILRDQLTFETHAFSQRNYEILVHIQPERSLGEVFEGLVERGCVCEDEEESFYHFIVDLHRRNLLKLPISDEKSSYERYKRHEAGRRVQLLMSVFSFKRSLLDPSRFLDRTHRFVRPFFSRWAFAVWLAVIGMGLTMVFLKRQELQEPLGQVLLAANLPILWLTLVGLKVIHELGHAYACRLLGGHVPEIGVNLIVFTPLPYVDATSSWSFPRKLDRIIVSVAGMYVELFIAALAITAWAFMEPSLARSMAYNTAFIASVVTIAFNLNPLMRFDGYYIFADLFEVPNLRARSAEACRNFFKRVLLGLPWPRQRSESRSLSGLLISFGFASTVYRITLVIGIASVIAQQYLVAGLALGAGYVGLEVVRGVKGLVRLLFFSEEMTHLKLRAGLAASLVFLALPVGVAYIPLPSRIVAPGLFAAEGEHVFRAERGGFLREVHVAASEELTIDSVLVRLEDPDAEAAWVEARRDARLAEAELRASRVGPAFVRSGAEQRANVRRQNFAAQEEELDHLEVRADREGTVIQCLGDGDLGRWVEAHEPVATICYGRHQVRCLLTERELVDAGPEPGRRVVFRPTSDPGLSLYGTVVQVRPAGSRRIEELTLTHLGGGGIAVSPLTGEAEEPHFLVTIELEHGDGVPLPDLLSGMRGRVLFAGETTTLGASVLRRLQRFVGRVRTSA